MYNFGDNSKKNLMECDRRLQDVLNRAIEFFDFSVVCGFRGKFEQDKAFANGLSKTPWPQSKHNKTPSLAADIYPWHAKYKSLTLDPKCIDFICQNSMATQAEARAFVLQEYCMMAQTVMICAKLCKVQLRWGGDWDRDLDRLDQTFNDLPHFELVE